MNILDLKEAATFLKMTPEGLRKKITIGEIPAAKVGKCWLLIEDDLVQYMRCRYSIAAETSWGVVRNNRRTKWRSTKEVQFGGSTSVTKGNVYNELLGLPTK